MGYVHFEGRNYQCKNLHITDFSLVVNGKIVWFKSGKDSISIKLHGPFKQISSVIDMMIIGNFSGKIVSDKKVSIDGSFDGKKETFKEREEKKDVAGASLRYHYF